MQSNILSETVLDLSAASVALQMNGKRPHSSTLWRWCRRGINGVRLEYARVGRRIVTSREALARWSQALAEADRQPREPRAPKPSSQRTRTPAARERAIAQARRELAASGI